LLKNIETEDKLWMDLKLYLEQGKTEKQHKPKQNAKQPNTIIFQR